MFLQEGYLLGKIKDLTDAVSRLEGEIKELKGGSGVIKEVVFRNEGEHQRTIVYLLQAQAALQKDDWVMGRNLANLIGQLS